MSRSRLLTLLAAVVLLASCAGGDTPADPTPTQPDDPPAEQTEHPDPPPEHQQLPDDDRIPAAIDDAAARTGTDPADVAVVHLHAVTWRDGAIGCPEGDMAYTQALVDGYHLLLRADSTELHYHAAGEEPFFFCPRPQEPLENTR